MVTVTWNWSLAPVVHTAEAGGMQVFVRCSFTISMVISVRDSAISNGNSPTQLERSTAVTTSTIISLILMGDGKKEIWGFTWDYLSFAVYEATGKDTYVLQVDVNQAKSISDYGEQNSVAFYDANKDGKMEMFVAGQTSPPSAVFYIGNTSDVSTLDTGSVKYVSPVMEAANFQGASIGDIDGDGEVDFFVGDWSSDNRKVYRLRHLKGQAFDDSMGYALDTLFSTPSDSTYAFPNVEFLNDVDGDGKRELAIINSEIRGDHPEDVAIFILESKVVVLSVKTVSNSIPAAFTLEQNFPNPFNPSSSIRFSLTSDQHVELFITNALGQQVGTLVNERMTAGTHEVKFNADGPVNRNIFLYIEVRNTD
jgi:hypothetical protein